MTFKYRVGIWMVPDLSLLLAACLEAHGMVDDLEGITWVPLHPARYRSRGFNQAALLAYTLARRYGLPRPTRCLVRWRPTETQTRLTAPRRVSNVEGAFWVPRRNRVAEKNWLLIDDVMTTGATLNACATELIRAGAESVDVVTVARGMI